MTDYNKWDKTSADLVKQAEEDDEEEKKQNDKALGLEDGPQGPPTAKAKKMREGMAEHGEGRKKFIAQQEAREVVVTHAEPSDEPIVLQGEEYTGKAVRLRGSKGVTYEFPKGSNVLKVFVESCTDVKVKLCCHVTTSFMEVVRCSNVDISIEGTIQMIQADECTKDPVRVRFLEPESIGSFFHQNCPSLEVTTPGRDAQKIGVAEPFQLASVADSSGEWNTEAVLRGEKEFPVQLGATHTLGKKQEPEAEIPPSDEMIRQEAEAKREEGNTAFRSNDFMQAAVFYTEALGKCDSNHLVWANRAQCWLRLGEPQKALNDATKCTELAPDYAKGWFRKGMALHSLERFGKAIPDLVQAEKLDPKNPQIPEAIKMAQLMCRKKGPGE